MSEVLLKYDLTVGSVPFWLNPIDVSFILKELWIKRMYSNDRFLAWRFKEARLLSPSPPGGQPRPGQLWLDRLQQQSETSCCYVTFVATQWCNYIFFILIILFYYNGHILLQLKYLK